MGSIKNVVTEPIEGHEDYNMMVCVYRNISNKLCTFSSNRLFYFNCAAAVRQKHFLSNNVYIYLYKYACLFVCHPRRFNWVRQKPHNIGSTGCLHSLLMQSKTLSSENGSIFNVPL